MAKIKVKINKAYRYFLKSLKERLPFYEDYHVKKLNQRIIQHGVDDTLLFAKNLKFNFCKDYIYDLHKLQDYVNSAFESDTFFVIPHKFSGRIDHYHHYFGAMILPILELIGVGHINSKIKIIIPEVGPISCELEEILDFFGVNYNFYPIRFLDVLSSMNDVSCLNLASYDYSFSSDYWLKSHQIEIIRNVVSKIEHLDDNCKKSEDPKILIVYRKSTGAYYKNKNVASGSDRRSIPNLEDLEKRLSTHMPTELIAFEDVSFKDKVRSLNSAKIIISQMGAALNGVLWAKKDAYLIEIQPLKRLKSFYPVFGNMCNKIGVTHFRILQGSEHQEVNVNLVESYVKHIINSESR